MYEKVVRLKTYDQWCITCINTRSSVSRMYTVLINPLETGDYGDKICLATVNNEDTDFLENRKKMFPLYYMYDGVFSNPQL